MFRPPWLIALELGHPVHYYLKMKLCTKISRSFAWAMQFVRKEDKTRLPEEELDSLYQQRIAHSWQRWEWSQECKGHLEAKKVTFQIKATVDLQCVKMPWLYLNQIFLLWGRSTIKKWLILLTMLLVYVLASRSAYVLIGSHNSPRLMALVCSSATEHTLLSTFLKFNGWALQPIILAELFYQSTTMR